MMAYRLAVILPAPYTGGVVRSLINICRMLVIGARACGDELSLTLGLPKGQSWSLHHQRIVAGFGIQTRFFELQSIARASLDGAYSSFGINTTVDLPAEAVVFNDGIANFEDSDFWYLISDAVPSPLPAHRKYACMIYDYANRYEPSIFDEEQWKGFHFRADATQGAAFVVTTTAQTRRDAITFAGADPERVHVFPLEFDPVDSTNFDITLPELEMFPVESFVLWPTIISQHENHLPVLAGLEEYLATNDMQVVVIGKGTSSFNPHNEHPSIRHPYVESVRKLIASSRLLYKRIVFKDFVSDEVMLALMRKALCVLHTSRGDNGSYTVVEAAWQGTPSLSNRYPAMENLGEYFGIPLEFFDFYRPGSLADGLRLVQRNRALLCSNLPPRSRLKEYSFENLAVRYWQLFSAQMSQALEAV